MIENKIIIVVIYLMIMVVLYIIICKRIDFLTKRNEQKIGENIRALEVMNSNTKWVLMFIFIIVSVLSSFILLTLY